VVSNRNRLRATDVHRLPASAQSGCWPVTRCQGYFAIAGAGARRVGIRYALYWSYVLLSSPPIEPITEHILDRSHSGNHSGWIERLMSPLLYH
jgi:hypothetical protein